MIIAVSIDKEKRMYRLTIDNIEYLFFSISSVLSVAINAISALCTGKEFEMNELLEGRIKDAMRNSES